jgi:glucose-6-phosphate isomerase
LRKNAGASFTADEIAGALGVKGDEESVFKILEHASANADHGVKKTAGKRVFESKYGAA